MLSLLKEKGRQFHLARSCPRHAWQSTPPRGGCSWERCTQVLRWTACGCQSVAPIFTLAPKHRQRGVGVCVCCVCVSGFQGWQRKKCSISTATDRQSSNRVQTHVCEWSSEMVWPHSFIYLSAAAVSEHWVVMIKTRWPQSQDCLALTFKCTATAHRCVAFNRSGGVLL